MTKFLAARKGYRQSLWNHGVADWLCLAASPTFALMAWLAAGGESAMPLCASASMPMPMDSMVWMYLLMCLFHASPWLKLAAGRHEPLNQRVPHIEGD